MADRCAFCQRPSSLKCGQCYGVTYCSKEHQRIDWKVHKENCIHSSMFKVSKDEKLGRHLISTRLINEGEVILIEKPLLSGPTFLTPPVCLGCYTLLNKVNSINCSRCGWPVCSKECENSIAHAPECEITMKYKKEKVSVTTFETNMNHPSYSCVSVLRCLYMKNNNKKVWNKLSSLETHYEERKKVENFEVDILIGDFIKRFLNYTDFTSEDIIQICLMIKVNSYSVQLKSSSIISIYDKASLFEHSCLANCVRSFTDDGKIVIIAGKDIHEGEHLSISYTMPIWGLKARQKHLLESKYFLCDCVRCSDPTELGTFFNAVKCITDDCKGYMNPLSTPDCVEEQWRCMDCGSTRSTEQLAPLFLTIKNGIRELDKKDPESCKKFIKKHEKYLHPNNYFMVEVKLALLDNSSQSMAIFASDEDLNFLIRIGNDMIELMARLMPAEYRLRGILYFNTYPYLLQLNSRKFSSGEIDASMKRTNLVMIKDMLIKAYNFLKWESDSKPEGQFARLAQCNIKKIDSILQLDQ